MEILGTTDAVDTCGCCGKTGLKRTVRMRLENGEVEYLGTTCAARATGTTAAEARVAALDAQRAADLTARAAVDAPRVAEAVAWLQFLVDRTGGGEVAAMVEKLGGFAAARAAFSNRDRT